MSESAEGPLPAACTAAESAALLALMECLLLAHDVAEQSHVVLLCTDLTRCQLCACCLMYRYGGMFVIGMAYRGTANNGAIQKLLHFAVSDVADDVRRAAVLCLGFVLMGVPEQCPRIVSLLSESYNPHVRYGAAMAVGIACASTGER